MASAGYTGEDFFTYKVFDGAEYSQEITVSLVVTNQVPVAAGDGVYEVHQGETLNVTAAEGVLLNDFDPDGDSLVVVLVTGVSHGSLYLNQNYDPITGWSDAPGGFYYAPNAGHVDTDAFSYRLFDGTEYSEVVTVSLNVTNQAPFAEGDGTYEVHHGQVLNVSAAEGVLPNDGDPDGDFLVAELVTAAAHGTLYFNQNYDPISGWSSVPGGFYYVPNGGYVGEDSFSYWVFDGAEYSAVATVTIEVTNQAPIAVEDGPYEVLRNRGINVTAAEGLLLNDYDPDGDSLIVELVAGVNHGSLYLNQNYDPVTGWESAPGGFYYLPHTDYVGEDAFSYRVTDGAFFSAVVAAPLIVANGNFVWDGGAADNNMSSAKNWKTNTAPIAGDDIQFDGTSPKNAVADAGFVASVGKIDVRQTYLGSLSVERDLAATEVVQAGSRITVAAANTLSAEKYTLTAGTLAGPGTFSIDALNGASVTLSGGKLDNDLKLNLSTITTTAITKDTIWNSTTITNRGTVEWTGGDIVTGQGTFHNFGSFVIKSDKTMDGFAFRFRNYGVVEKTAGVGSVGLGTTTIEIKYSDIAVAGSPIPRLLANSGTLSFLQGGEHTVSLFVSALAKVELGLGLGQGDVFYSGSEFVGFGTVVIRFQTTIPVGHTLRSSGHVVMNNGSLIGGGVFITSGQFDWLGGAINELTSFVNSGLLWLQGANAKLVRKTVLLNTNQLLWTGAADITMEEATIDNRGTFDAQSGASIKVIPGIGGVAVGSFMNSGTFTKAAGSGHIFIDPTFTNTGIFLLNGTSVDFKENFSQTGANAVFRVGGGVVTVNGLFDVDGGLLSGTGSIVADVRLNANLDFGNAIGVLHVMGNYTQTANGRMTVKIGGNANSDTLHVFGTSTLAGDVSVQLVGGYNPVAGVHISRFLVSAGVRNGILNPPPGWAVAAGVDELSLTF